ncbi:MAG: helix-turn-helix domain-containing protein [Phycisphaerae bacterium]
MATTDRGGEVAFTREGVRLLDRIRALASSLDSAPSPAFLASLRQAAGLTQEELGRRIGRDKLTISRWERGTMRPSRESLGELAGLFRRVKRSGVVLPG